MGPIHLWEVSEAERKSSISASLLAKETCTTWRSGDVQLSCKAHSTGQPCFSHTRSRVMPLLLSQTGFTAPASGIPTMCLEINTCFTLWTFPALTELSEEFVLQSSWEKSSFQTVLQRLFMAVLFFCQPKAEWLELDREKRNEASL